MKDGDLCGENTGESKAGAALILFLQLRKQVFQES